MYDWVDQEGYGQYLIAKMLNEKGIKTNKGKAWASNSVSVVLRNPMYKGYTVYGRGTDKEVVSRKQNAELVIIDEAKWARVQAIREKRNPENTKKKGIECILRNTKGSLLLVGMARCGHCGNPLTTTWNTKKYTRKDGTEIVKREAKYRCSGKALQKVKCSGKTIHSPICLEGIVLDEIYAYLDQLETVDLKEQIEQIKSRNSGDEEKALRKHQKLTDKAKMELSSLKDEVLKVIMGKSPLDREMVNEMVKKKESEVSLLLAKLEMFEQELNAKKVEQVEIQALQTYIPVWREVFKKASTAKKKMMLSTIIECVRVYRDSVELTLKLNISSFLATASASSLKGNDLNAGDNVLGKALSHHTKIEQN